MLIRFWLNNEVVHMEVLKQGFEVKDIYVNRLVEIPDILREMKNANCKS